MSHLKAAFLCAMVNIKKWAVNPRVSTLAVLLFAFIAWHLSGLSAYANAVTTHITPWIFPHLFSTSGMIMIFSSFTILFYSDAPFMDTHTPFIMIRSGRRNWVIGQLLYVILAGFIYTLFIAIISALVLIPNVHISSDWGKVLRTLAAFPDSPSRYGVPASIFVSHEIVGIFSVGEAMLLSFGLFWLVTVFIGVLIFFFNAVVAKMSGIIIAGIFVFVSYFSEYLGRFSFGSRIYYFSPLSWSSLMFLDLNYRGQLPSISYAVVFLVLTIVVMGIASVVKLCAMDYNR